MAIIYKFTNKTNGKSYIGQTTRPKERYIAHKCHYNKSNYEDYDKKFYRALRKYGWENFTYEILEECDDDGKVLTEKEQYYIDKFDSIENGYNTIGAVESKYYTTEQKEALSEISHLKNASLSYEEVEDIRTRYLKGEKPSEVYKDYEDRLRNYYSFMNIWTGARYGYIMPEVFNIRENRVKLDYDKAQDIRFLYKELGYTYKQIAELYGIGQSTVRDVIRERTWKTKKPVSTISS